MNFFYVLCLIPPLFFVFSSYCSTDGRLNFSTQQDMVSTVKDPTSDMATCAHNGSAVVANQREKRERNKMRTRYWEVGGSRIGDAMGIKKTTDNDDAEG